MNEPSNPEIRNAIIAITLRLLAAHGTIEILNVGPWAEVFPPGAQHDMMAEPIGTYDGISHTFVAAVLADHPLFGGSVVVANCPGFIRLSTRPTPPTEQESTA